MNDASVKMKMIQQGLIPGVQHGDETELSAKPSTGKINERFANGL